MVAERQVQEIVSDRLLSYESIYVRIHFWSHDETLWWLLVWKLGPVFCSVVTVAHVISLALYAS